MTGDEAATRRRRLPGAVVAVALPGAVVAGVLLPPTWSTPTASGVPTARPETVADAATKPDSNGIPPVPVMACPGSIPAVQARQGPASPLTVPAPPVGFEGTDRLVPTDTPAGAVLCRYATKANADVVPAGARDALNGRVVLRSDLRALADDLTWLPRVPDGQVWPGSSTEIGGPLRGYLVGLAYADGRRVWVAAGEEPNGSYAATNGRFRAGAYLGSKLNAAYRTGVWQPPGPASAADPCVAGGPYAGRLTDASSLVPDGATDVTICVDRLAGVRLPADQAAAVVTAVRAAPTRSYDGRIDCADQPEGPYRRILIGYGNGPGVTVMLMPGCDPQVFATMGASADPGNTIDRAVDAALRQAAAHPAPMPPGPAPIPCPSTRRLPVPARGSSAALVPKLTPDAVTVCGYNAAGRFLRARQVTVGLDTLAEQLPWTARRTAAMACVPGLGALPSRPLAGYLVGLRYGASIRWFDPGSAIRRGTCVPATNGMFVARSSYYASAAQAFANGAWTDVGDATGRLGDDRALVPSGLVTQLTLTHGQRSGSATNAQAVALLRAMRPVPVRPVAAGVRLGYPTPGAVHVSVDYGFGSPVLIEVTGRSVTGAALRGTMTPAQARRVVAALEAILPRVGR